MRRFILLITVLINCMAVCAVSCLVKLFFPWKGYECQDRNVPMVGLLTKHTGHVAQGPHPQGHPLRVMVHYVTVHTLIQLWGRYTTWDAKSIVLCWIRPFVLEVVYMDCYPITLDIYTRWEQRQWTLIKHSIKDTQKFYNEWTFQTITLTVANHVTKECGEGGYRR